VPGSGLAGQAEAWLCRFLRLLQPPRSSTSAQKFLFVWCVSARAHRPFFLPSWSGQRGHPLMAVWRCGCCYLCAAVESLSARLLGRSGNQLGLKELLSNDSSVIAG